MVSKLLYDISHGRFLPPSAHRIEAGTALVLLVGTVNGFRRLQVFQLLESVRCVAFAEELDTNYLLSSFLGHLGAVTNQAFKEGWKLLPYNLVPSVQLHFVKRSSSHQPVASLLPNNHAIFASEFVLLFRVAEFPLAQHVYTFVVLFQ